MEYGDSTVSRDPGQSALWLRIREHNSWEGETWYHYFLAEKGKGRELEDALLSASKACTGLGRPYPVSLTWSAAEALANDEPGYMATHWFGKLTNFEVAQASTDDLYKGGIRKFGEEMMEYAGFEPTLREIGSTPYVENWVQDLEDEGLVPLEPIEEDE